MLVALAGFVPASGGVFSNTFIPDRPINVPQDFISYAMGTGRKGDRLQSLQVSDSSCKQALGTAFSLISDGLYDESFDSICYYLSNCYAQADPATAFGVFRGSAGDTDENIQGKATIKNFLLSILPLRTDDDWFCQCVWCFGAYFAHDTNADREGMSLDKWLIDNPRCSMIHNAAILDYNQGRKDDSSLWADTTHWPDTVYDTTLLTMQQMGLDSVLIISATEGVSPEAIGSQILLSASITENPFPNSTSILLSIGREAYVTIQVFDILGHQIEGAGYASVFEQGNVTIPINMTNAPPGAYLVRISTANNEVQTLKLTKE